MHQSINAQYTKTILHTIVLLYSNIILCYLMHWYTNALMHVFTYEKYTNALMHNYTNALIHLWFNVLVHQCDPVCYDIPYNIYGAHWNSYIATNIS